jgi:hypothetical protein
MKITSQEIRDALIKVWPDLEYIWLWDTTYWTPSKESVQKALETSNVSTMDFIDEFNDCDNFALQFLAECRRKRYLQWKAGNLPIAERHSMSIGYVFGDQFLGIGKLHVTNIALCNDGEIYIVDSTPAENRMWKASPVSDTILFVFM